MKMVVSLDVRIEEIHNVLGKGIVGWFCGKIVPHDLLRKWLEVNWKSFLGYMLVFHVLTRGWLCFFMHSDLDAETLLGKIWS
jgi:hypothetical protein